MTARLGGSPGGAETWTGAARGALGGGLERPSLWPLALLAFLLRGGWFVVLLPILVVPSPVGIATFVGPTAVTPAGPSASLVGLIAGVAIAVTAWLLLGGLAAEAAEAVLIRASPGGAPVVSDAPAPVGLLATLALPARMLRARLIASAPLAAALAWGIPRTVGAAYAELVTPSDPAIPLQLRVLRDIPDALAVVVAAWLVGEVVGGVAVRRVLLFGEGARVADVRALRHLVRRPAASLATVVLTLVGSGAIAVPSLVVAAVSWDRVAWALRADAHLAVVALLTIVFVAAWLSGLVLAAAAAAWRSVAWTVEVLRADRGSVPMPRPEAAGADS